MLSLRSTDAEVSARHTALMKSFCLALTAFAVFALLQTQGETAAGVPGLMTVTVTKLVIHQSDSDTSRAVFTLYKGNIVKVLSIKGIWSRISTSGGKTGWCQSHYLAGAVYSSSLKSGNTTSLDWPSEHIDLSKPFTYQRCMQDMQAIADTYGDMARVETFGTTVMGNPMKAIVIGSPDAPIKVLFQASIHSRESITALIALRQAECLLKAASVGAAYRGVKLKDLLEGVQVWVVPMSNPDGVRLVYEGLSAVPASMPQLAASLSKMNKGSADFTRWKANAHGVDLNRNFDAGWKPDPNYKVAGPLNYPGPRPFSEPESIALRDLTTAQDFALTMSYHSSGEVIYWYSPAIGQNSLDLYLANAIKKLTGYTVLSTAAQEDNGGYKDWFLNQFRRPGFTVEVGTGYCPLPQNNFSTYWNDMRYVMLDMIWTAVPKSLTVVAGQ